MGKSDTHIKTGRLPRQAQSIVEQAQFAAGVRLAREVLWQATRRGLEIPTIMQSLGLAFADYEAWQIDGIDVDSQKKVEVWLADSMNQPAIGVLQ